MGSTVLRSELEERFLGTEEHEKPSVMRLVQLYMSKQMPSASVLGDGLLAESKAAYLRCLRSNATIHASPQKAPPKKASNSSQSNKLFSPPTCMQNCRHGGAGGEDELDTVQREVQDWSELPAATISSHIDVTTNMVNTLRTNMVNTPVDLWPPAMEAYNALSGLVCCHCIQHHHHCRWLACCRCIQHYHHCRLLAATAFNITITVASAGLLPLHSTLPSLSLACCYCIQHQDHWLNGFCDC